MYRYRYTDPYQGHQALLAIAYGPHRFFRGTDITRMPCSCRQCVTMLTEDLPWLTGRDLELAMGRAVCDWIGWQLEAS